MNAELIARLEAAEVGSRELDVRVVAACNPNEWCVGDLEIALEDPDRRLNPQHYTTSLDASIALGERVLKTAHHIRLDKDALWMVSVWYDPDDAPVGFGASKKPALALCIAILRALDAQEQK